MCVAYSCGAMCSVTPTDTPRYTSLGSTINTVPNPLLRNPSAPGGWDPAWKCACGVSSARPGLSHLVSPSFRPDHPRYRDLIVPTSCSLPAPCSAALLDALPLLARCTPTSCSSSESADSSASQCWTNRKNVQAGSTRLHEVPGNAGQCGASPSIIVQSPSLSSFSLSIVISLPCRPSRQKLSERIRTPGGPALYQPIALERYPRFASRSPR